MPPSLPPVHVCVFHCIVRSPSHQDLVASKPSFKHQSRAEHREEQRKLREAEVARLAMLRAKAAAEAKAKAEEERRERERLQAIADEERRKKDEADEIQVSGLVWFGLAK